MKKIHTNLWKVGLAAVMALLAAQAPAQNALPEGLAPVIAVPTSQNVNYSERTLCYNVQANVPFEVTSDSEWATVREGADGSIYIHLSQNLDNEARVAKITFSNLLHGITRTMELTQGKDQSVEEVPTDILVTPKSATANTTETSRENCPISYTYDNNYSTFWHSQYSPTQFVVSEDNPAVLTYNFLNVEKIDYVRYYPRQDQANGYFGKVKIETRKAGETDYVEYGTFDFRESATPTTVTFNGGLENPGSIRFTVYSGSGNFATCAEMQFCVTNPETTALFESLFRNDLYSMLAPGVTEEMIDEVENSFVKSLALRLLSGNYDTHYRVASYVCRTDPTVLSEKWNAPGKLYDQFDGVTGINITKGQHAIVVRDIPDGQSASLKVVAWYEGKDGGNFDGGNPQVFTYGLTNGINVINYDFDYDGLAYICYYTSDDPATVPNIRVHFINGDVNGYLSPDKTNEEMHELCANAKSMFMDAVGSKVHSVWTAKGFHDYCKASDGTSLGYRQFMNVLDSLVDWEHQLLGFYKYDLVPNNHTFAYTNYTYYMFQGGLGVSFHHDQESRVLNCRTLMYNDNDVIWGLSHEWGHQHQMHPYFCWAGMTEVTNNMNSYYNVMHMGYKESDKIEQWAPARRHFINDEEFKNGTTVSEGRRLGYALASSYAYSTDMRDLCLAMADSVIKPYSENPARAVHISDVGVGETLCPFIMLYNYATMTLGLKDFGPDMYEALRQTDDENGSQIEKKGEVDKYELIASAQNGNKNGKLAVLKSKYPTSCWVTRNYITEAHCGQWDNSVPYVFNYIRKVSRLTGYNLFPYFEKWGFLRQVAMSIGDYGNKSLILTEAMYDEFKADMDALVTSGELKAMPDGLVETISNMRDINIDGDIKYSTPDIPN